MDSTDELEQCIAHLFWYNVINNNVSVSDIMTKREVLLRNSKRRWSRKAKL
jgi:hypothetical protein